MRIFIDTNVLIDLLIKRTPQYTSVARLFEHALQRKDALVISTLSIVNAHYVVKRNTTVDESALRNALHNICVTCEIASFTLGITMKSLASAFKDFEDATQYFCAVDNLCDVLVTSNTKDFKQSSLPVMTPDEFLLSYLTLLETKE